VSEKIEKNNEALRLYLPSWIDFVKETFIAGVQPSTTPIRFTVVPLLQQSLYCSFCFYRLGFLTESFCHLSLSSAVRLIYGFSRIINETIAYTLLLFLNIYYIFHLSFIVQVPPICRCFILYNLF
jgi:hypothetical protein